MNNLKSKEMNREIKFRAWDENKKEFFDPNDQNQTFGWYAKGKEKSVTLSQFTGLLDKNGKEIYEGDVLRWIEISTDYQTHTGDNIPNGSYTEPIGIIAKRVEYPIVYEAPIFKTDVEEIWHCPINSYHNFDKISLSEICGLPNNVSDSEFMECAVLYVCDELKMKFTNMEDFWKSINGVEVIGNIYQNPNLLNEA